MRIYQLLDVEGESFGLLKVTSKSNNYDKIDVDIKSAVKDVYLSDDYDGTDELFELISEKLSNLGYDSERFFIEEIYVY